MKCLKQLLTLTLFVVIFSHPHVAYADGGLAVRPYWTFRTDAPVTHVQAGDINGDGVQEIVALDGKFAYVLENDGDLAWRYEMGVAANALLVTNLDDEPQTDEIFIGRRGRRSILLSNTHRPVWDTGQGVTPESEIGVFAIDLDGDGRHDLLRGFGYGVDVLDNETGEYLAPGFFIQQGTWPVISVWAGDMDGDGRPEIVPGPAGGYNVSVWEDSLEDLAWQTRLKDEVGLVQVGDVDGDGQVEVIVLTASWDLILLESDGQQGWQQRIPFTDQDTGPPASGQLILRDLDRDSQPEIVVMALATVFAFTGDGQPIWQQPLAQPRDSKIHSDPLSNAAGRLTACAINSHSSAAMLATIPEEGVTYALTADGYRLAEYRSGETTTTLACADLNADDHREIIIGTETGVQVFGVSLQVERKELWRSSLGWPVFPLRMNDLNGDGLDEIVAAIGKGERILGLTIGGRVVWEVPFGAPPLALNIGDVDNDGQNEIAMGTWVDKDGGQIFLLDDNQSIWTVPVGLWVKDIAIWDGRSAKNENTSENWPQIIAGVQLLDNSKAALVLNNKGEEVWRRKFDSEVTAVSSSGLQALVGTASGQVYRLTAEGEPAGEYNLGAKILSLEADLAATSSGQVYQLEGDTPTLVHDFGEPPTAVQLGDTLATGFEEGRFSVVVGDEVVWEGTVEDEITSIASGDVNGDGEIEIAVGAESGQVHIFGLVLDQPLLLTKSDLTETRTGYTYSVQVNDPEGEAVPVILEIWDPSTDSWLPQSAQSLAEDQDRGQLSWDVSALFDIWDSGQESRFRFVYEEGGQHNISPEIPGPFNIPTTPWYLHYGQQLGLGTLILLVPALALLLYHRQRTYRRSPAGQAESLLKQLQAQPDEILTHFHTLTNDNPALLTYLAGAARQAGETAIAELSEGHNLLLVRPEVTAEDLRMVVDAIRRLDGPSDEKKTKLIDIFDLFQQALEANTVNRIVSLSVRWHELLTGAEAELGVALNDLNEVIKTLNNFQRIAAFEDKTAYLGQTLEALGRLEREFRTGAMWQPAGNILARIAANWLLAVNNALQDLQGRAQIEAALKTRHLLNLEQASLSLELTNTGRSPASNVTVSLIPDQKFAVGNGTTRLDVLAAGRSAVVELPISAAASVEQFRAEFNITFDDRERSGKSLAFADRVHLLRPTNEFQTMPNPYAPGTPLVPGSPIFFGRADLFEFVTQNLAGLTRQNILVLIGQRRMGKTSFLQQLPARLGNDYLPVYLDGQSLGIDPGMANFFYDLALAIVDTLVDQGIEIEEPEPEDFEERPSGTFERTFLPLVFEAIGERQLLLLFDEFEELEMRVTSGKLEATIFPFLRHLMQHNRKLGFIFVGTHRLEALSTDYWSIFFNIALYKHVVFLSEIAARALITEPVAGYGLVYDDLALDKMLRVTAGHPYFLQLTCHALVNHANRERRGYLTIQDVNSVLDEMVELGEAHFAFLWERSSPSEQLMLSTLTRLLGQEPTVTATQVVELLAERGITREVQDVIETLRQLGERDVIREIAGQPPRYEYKVELVRLWIERYKALGRVVEENHVN